jgi:hypothetical protein
MATGSARKKKKTSSEMVVVCPPFWLDMPRILWEQAHEFFPFTKRDQRCTAAALNSFTRFGIYLGILLALLRADVCWLSLGILFGLFSVLAWKYMGRRASIREGFVDTKAPVVEASDVQDRYVPDVIEESGRTGPTAANPFMNVLMSEISENPYRNPAENIQTSHTKTYLGNYFETMFASDPGDTFQRTQSQRQWVSMPSTTVPNDQESFQNWLYRTPGQSCKEGNQEVCVFDTGDAALPWREMRKLT